MRRPLTGAVLRITLPYAILAGIWIFTSDRLLSLLPLDVDALTGWSIVKGLAFVLFTSGLLAVLLRRELLARSHDQEALAESEARLRLIGDSLPDSYVFQYVHEPRGKARFLYLSSGVQRLHGVSAEAALRDASLLVEQVDPEQRTALARKVQNSVATLSDFAMELRIRRADGQWRWMMMRAHPQRTPSGSIVWSGVAADITERQQAEWALRERETMLHALGDNIPSGALYQLLSPPQGPNRYTYLSAGTERLFGLSAASVLADPRPFWDLIAEEDRPRIDAAQAKSARELSVFECEFRQRTVTGEQRWFLARATPRRLDDGAILWDGVVTDITDQKRASDALRESETRFRTLIESAPDAVFVQSEGRFAYLNRAAVTLLGAANPQELLGAPCLDRIAPEFRPAVRDRIRAQVETGRPAPLMDQEYLRLDGARVPVEVTATPIRFENREAHVVFLRDITARKRAEAERERLLAAMEQSSEIVVITDAKGAIQYVNPAFEHATGYSRAEAAGQNPRLLKSGKHEPDFYRQLWQTVRSGKTWRGRFVNRRKDGTLFTEEAALSPVRDNAGHLVNIVAVKRDITVQLHLEAQLQQAQKMESVGRLAGGVAHDFNNMLSVILGNAELALDATPPDSAVHADLLEIERAAQRSAELTKQLLAFARKQTTEPKVIDLNGSVVSMLKMLRRLIGENVELVWNPCPRDTTVRIDPHQLDQILANLAVNARDAISGAGVITIETGFAALTPERCAGLADVAAGDYVTLRVTDTGHGMDPDTLEHIFEPFFTTKAFGAGTGLGLATVYGIVRQNHGHIEVDSEMDKGTAFTVFLPYLAQGSSEQPAAQRPPLAGARQGRVLLVEDEQAILQMAQRTLERLGYRVKAIDRPAEALRWAESHASEIDLLLTDIVMPQLSGCELAKRLREHNPKVRLLFMSGHTSDAALTQDLLASSSGFLQKPFSLHLLSSKVGEALGDDDRT